MKYFKPLGLPLLATPFYCIPVSHAQMASATDNIDERVVVTATQTQQSWLTTPASVTRVSRDRQLPTLNIDAGDLLEGIPGIQADSRYNYAQDTRIVIRGFGSRAAFGVRSLQLNIDGIPLSMPDGQAQTSSIMLDDAHSVEVLRGPLAVLYGNSGGGVVEWQSLAPQLSSISFATQLSADNLQRYTADLQYVGDTHQFKLMASDFQTDGPRPHNSAEREQQAFRWYMDISDSQRLIVRYDNNYAPLLQDPSALTPSAWREDPEQTVQRAIDFNTRKSIHHRQGSLSWELERDNATYRVSAWQGDRDIVQFLPFSGADATSSGAVIDLSRQFEGIHAFANWSLNNHVNVSAGWIDERQQDHRFGLVNYSGERGDLRRDEFNHIDSRSLYGRIAWQLAPNWQLDGGLRYNDIDYRVTDSYIAAENPDDSGSRTFDELSSAAALTWQATEKVSAYVSYGEGFETPTLTELAYRNEGSGLNRNLAPSTNSQYEAGLKAILADDWRLGLSYFDIHSDNEILVDQSNDGRTTYRNAAQTSRDGFELSLEGDITERLNAWVSYTDISAVFDSGSLRGNTLPGVAEQQAFARLNYDLAQQWQLQLSARYRGNTFTADENTVSAPNYTVFDAALRKSWQIGAHQLQGWLLVDNISDKSYVGAVVVNQGSGRAFEPAVGRQVSVGLKWTRRF